MAEDMSGSAEARISSTLDFFLVFYDLVDHKLERLKLQACQHD